MQLWINVTLINLNKGEQFDEDFKKISPFSKIPVLRHDNQTIFESGAILIYLANLSGQFYGSNKIKNLFKNKKTSPDKIIELALEDLKKFKGNNLTEDDITLLMAKIINV